MLPQVQIRHEIQSQKSSFSNRSMSLRPYQAAKHCTSICCFERERETLYISVILVHFVEISYINMDHFTNQPSCAISTPLYPWESYIVNYFLLYFTKARRRVIKLKLKSNHYFVFIRLSQCALPSPHLSWHSMIIHLLKWFVLATAVIGLTLFSIWVWWWLYTGHLWWK